MTSTSRARPIRRRHARCKSSPSTCSRLCWSHHAPRQNRSSIRVFADKTWLLPNNHVRQRAVDAPQQRVTHAGKAAEQAQIEAAFAAVPAIIAGRGGSCAKPRPAAAPQGCEDRGDPARRRPRRRIRHRQARRSTACRRRKAGLLWRLRRRFGYRPSRRASSMPPSPTLQVLTLRVGRRRDPCQPDAGEHRDTTGKDTLCRPSRKSGQYASPSIVVGILQRQCIRRRHLRSLRVPSPPTGLQAHRQSLRHRATCH